MCTPGDDNILIVGTIHGSIALYDLKEFESQSRTNEDLDYDALLKAFQPEIAENEEYQDKLFAVRSRFSIQWPTYSTDGLPNYCHFCPIRKLLFVTKFGGGTAQIGVIDELLTISTWSVMEIQAHIAEKLNDFDLNMSIGGRFKLLENFSESLLYMPEILGNHDI